MSWFRTALDDRFIEKTLDIMHALVRTWGVMRGAAFVRGDDLPVLDSLIASPAQIHRVTVVARNVRDMSRCGVASVNPWVE